MPRELFAVGSDIKWIQYRTKRDTVGVARTGIIWSDAPKFPGVAGGYAWVIPDTKYRGENNAIAVRVFRGWSRRGEAEVREDCSSYTEYSLRKVTVL